MNHRLFHTLVLSGAALVEACASAPAPAAAAPEATAQPAEPAGTAAPADAAPSADEVHAMVADARACEPGWPTTKSASLYPPQRVALNGRTYACVVRPDRATQCCLREPAP